MRKKTRAYQSWPATLMDLPKAEAWAQAEAQRTRQPYAVISWMGRYEVRDEAKALGLAQRHPSAEIISTHYPEEAA